jgi:hypothetical protein
VTGSPLRRVAGGDVLTQPKRQRRDDQAIAACSSGAV